MIATDLILRSLGKFTNDDIGLFENHIHNKEYGKDDILLKENNVCRSFYYIIEGAFFQFSGSNDKIIDLHIEGEWMFNQYSLIEQTRSTTTIQAFQKARVIELTLENLHLLINKSAAFLQMMKTLNQIHDRAFLFDQSLTPFEKYSYLNKSKPGINNVFPVKMIASYLKIAPETLSRVRAKQVIS